MPVERKKIFTMLVLLMSGMFVMYVNNSVINVLLPVLMRDLHIPLTTAQWLSNGFLLTSAMLVPVSAFFLKRFRWKNLFITSMCCFIAGSLLCGSAESFPVIMAGRIIQSAGAGISAPLTLNVITYVFPAEQRGKAMGIYMLGNVLAPACGPTITGFAIHYYPWNLLFYTMAGLEALILLATLKYFEFKNEVKWVRFDIGGACFCCIGCGAMLFAISEKSLWSLCAGALFLTTYVFWSRQKGEDAMLDLRVFRNSNFTYTLIVNMVFTMAMYSGMILTPLYIQHIRGYSSLISGLCLLPGSLAMGLLGLWSGRFFDKHGIKLLAIIGSLGITVINLLMSSLTMDTPIYYVAGIYFLRGISLGLLLSPIASAGLATLERREIPHANALNNTSKQVFSSFGNALAVFLMTIFAGASTELHGVNMAFLVMSSFGVISFVLALFLKKRPSSVKTIVETY